MTGPSAPLPPEASGDAPGRGRLEDRRVVVVGAGTAGGPEAEVIGNGQAVSRLAAREGAAVACVDVDRGAAERTAAAIDAAGGSSAVVEADVADPEQCGALVTESVAALGGLDHVVCNVGIGGGFTVEGTSVEEWDRVLAVNLRAHFLVAQAALRQEGLRSLVFVGSVAGLRAGSRIPSYDASKAGLLGLNRQVAHEGARRGVRANVVVPGLIDTPLGRWASAGRPSRREAPVPLRREGTAWEVAYAVLFLLGDEASYVTGQHLVVDGGLTS